VHKKSSATRGFTIVELLIVIVIIGILAAITIVAYNGIQNRARTAAVTSSLDEAAKQLELSKVEAGTYPSTTSSLQKAGDVDFQYSYTPSSDSYCLTATKDAISYRIQNSNKTPVQGGCAGHGQNGVAAITNLIPNPSFEASGWAGCAGASATTPTPQSGTKSWAVTTAASTTDTFCQYNLPLQPGTYSVSLYVYLTGGGATFNNRDAMFYNISGLSISPGTVVYNRSALNQWQRVSRTFTTTTAGSLGVRFYSPAGTTNYFDAVMAAQENTLSGYADGSSEDWLWNGTQNNSTSTGPPK
jgi:prepilin-type N-terminal cleavage/methylation domain-containing protein